jgi:P-type Ca2+ transporter type 2C
VGIASELTLIVLIVYTPFMHQFIGTNSFPLSNWLFLILLTPILFLADEVRKWFVRRSQQKARETRINGITKKTEGGEA